MNLLMAPKDMDNITNKRGTIYRFKCAKAGCNEENIGELERSFGDRLKEHLMTPSPYMSMAILPNIASMWTVSPLWVGRYRVLPGPSWRLCPSGSMIHPSPET